MSFSSYASYKDSGLPWLGVVPANSLVDEVYLRLRAQAPAAGTA